MLITILLIVLFTILNWLDYYLTKKILDHGGIELNPVVEVFGLLPVKIGSTILFGLAGYFISYQILIPAIIVMAGVCIWNLIQVRRIK